MTAILTGDVIDSSLATERDWLVALKDVLRRYGRWPRQWEIYRGDSFQLACAAQDALTAAIHIKAGMRHAARCDVRIAIGIGLADKPAKRITESSGEAYVRSGQAFDRIKKQHMVISSPWADFDEQFNLYLRLAGFVMNHWTVAQAGLVKYMIEYPDKTQKSIAKKFKVSQSTLSERLKSSGFSEVKELIKRYSKIVLEQ